MPSTYQCRKLLTAHLAIQCTISTSITIMASSQLSGIVLGEPIADQRGDTFMENQGDEKTGKKFE